MRMLFSLTIVLGLAAGLALSGPSTPRAETTASRNQLVAQTDTAPAERTTTETTTTVHPIGPPKHILFSCSEKTCGCKGNDDCFDLGSKGVCSSSAWDCKADNSCICTKKAQ